jgi:hypothetical protein
MVEVDIACWVRSYTPAAARVTMLCTALGLAGCATAPMTQSGALASYQTLSESNGVLAKSVLNVDKDAVLAASTIRIMPTSFSGQANEVLSDEQRRLVANAVDRALCLNLSERFTVVAPYEKADLTTRTFITQATATDPVAAGASKVVSAVPGALGVPVPVPRLPRRSTARDVSRLRWCGRVAPIRSPIRRCCHRPATPMIWLPRSAPISARCW